MQRREPSPWSLPRRDSTTRAAPRGVRARSRHPKLSRLGLWMGLWMSESFHNCHPPVRPPVPVRRPCTTTRLFDSAARKLRSVTQERTVEFVRPIFFSPTRADPKMTGTGTCTGPPVLPRRSSVPRSLYNGWTIPTPSRSHERADARRPWLSCLKIGPAASELASACQTTRMRTGDPSTRSLVRGRLSRPTLSAPD